MVLTRNAALFAAVNSVSSIVFLIALNNLVAAGQFDDIAPWAIGYGLTWAITGAALGGTDKAPIARRVLDFQYAAIQYGIALLAIWGAKLFLPVIMPYGHGPLLLVTTVLAVAAILHYRHAKKSHKGVSQAESAA
jgi:hypothetical protein